MNYRSNVGTSAPVFPLQGHEWRYWRPTALRVPGFLIILLDDGIRLLLCGTGLCIV